MHKPRAFAVPHYAVVADRYANAFLTSVLERVQNEIDLVRRVDRSVGVNAEHPTFFVYLPHLTSNSSSP